MDVHEKNKKLVETRDELIRLRESMQEIDMQIQQKEGYLEQLLK